MKKTINPKFKNETCKLILLKREHNVNHNIYNGGDNNKNNHHGVKKYNGNGNRFNYHKDPVSSNFFIVPPGNLPEELLDNDIIKLLDDIYSIDEFTMDQIPLPGLKFEVYDKDFGLKGDFLGMFLNCIA